MRHALFDASDLPYPTGAPPRFRSANRYARLVVLVLTLASLVLTACASPSAPSQAASQTAPAAAPKTITAGVRGDPKILSDAINFAAGGSSVAGVREIENLLNAGLTVS